MTATYAAVTAAVTVAATIAATIVVVAVILAETFSNYKTWLKPVCGKQGNTNWRGRLRKVSLRIKVASFVKSN